MSCPPPLDGGGFFMYYTYMNGTRMTLTLRPHQKRILNSMLAYDKGQVIVPTGGGKTICMIQDVVELSLIHI